MSRTATPADVLAGRARYAVPLGDCRSALPLIPSGTAQTCVTSPPYYGLRDYGCEGQIGLEQTPAEYVAQIVAVMREVRRASLFGRGRVADVALRPLRLVARRCMVSMSIPFCERPAQVVSLRGVRLSGVVHRGVARDPGLARAPGITPRSRAPATPGEAAARSG